MFTLNRSTLTTVIVNYNTGFLLHEALGALRAASNELDVKTIIIDNASKDESVAVIQKDFPDCMLIANSENVGFGRANNQALPFVESDYVLLLNTDAFVQPDSLTKSLAFMQQNPRCGVLGVKLTGRDGQLQPSARFFPTPWSAFLHRTGLQTYFAGVRMVDDRNWDVALPRQCDWVPGCYYLIRKAVLDQVGLFDPRYFLYFEEVDHCFAVKKAGWDVICYPGTTVVHIGGESAKSDGAITKSGRQLESLQIESELLYFRKNHGLVAVFADVVLSSLADLINAGKHLFKQRSVSMLPSFWHHTALYWSIFFRTAWGSHPTR